MRNERSSSRGRGATNLAGLLAPRQPRKQSMGRAEAPRQTESMADLFEDDPEPGLANRQQEPLDPTVQEERKAEKKLVVPSKLIKTVSAQPPKQPVQSLPQAAKMTSATPGSRFLAKQSPMESVKNINVMSSVSSVISNQHSSKTPAPVKVQKLDLECLRRTFYGFTGEFGSEADLFFKNYNRFIKESRNKIDVQVKATKREKLLHAQFLNREEIKFWKEFPRSCKFYHKSLASVKQAMEPCKAQQRGGARVRTPSTQATNVQEVRDLDLLVLTALDFQPFSSPKFSRFFGSELTPLETDDAWRNAAIGSSDTRPNDYPSQDRPEEELSSFSSLTAPTNIATFDNLTQALKMFDSEDAQNWRILGMTAMLLVADTLALILEQPSRVQLDAVTDKKNKSDKQLQPPLELSCEVAAKLLDLCRRLASWKLPQDQGEEELDELSIIDILFDKVQFTWANKIFPALSTLSPAHFDSCLKFVQRALQNDHRTITNTEKEKFVQEIYFGRYLIITPESVNRADKVLGLLEKFLQLLQSDHCGDDFKLGLLATLKYLVENLCFYQSEVCGRPNIVPLKGLSFDPNAMQIQAASVARIYAVAEQLSARQSFKEHAVLLMATILKISTEDFVESKLVSFLTLIKFKDFFKHKKTYAFELKIANQLYLAGPIHLQKYKAWQPKVHQRSKLMIENRAFKVLTPVVDMVESLDHVSLGRRLSLRSVPQGLLPTGISQPRGSRFLIHSLPDYFFTIFNPQLVGLKTCPVDYTHWQFLEQAVYDDFEFMGGQGIPYLLEQRWTDLGTPLLNLGLKLADYVLDPSRDFRLKYYQLHGGLSSSKGMQLGQQIKNLRKVVCKAMKHIFRSQVHLNGDFMSQSMTFWRDSETKSLCNDQIGAIWSRPDYERILERPAQVSKDLKSQDLAKFHLQERHRLITFEDLNEINSGTDFQYENNYLNLLQKEIDSFTSRPNWDKKKEKFVRQRLSCFVAGQSQERQKAKATGASSSPLTNNPASTATSRRQNTKYYNGLGDAEREHLRLLRRLVSMVPYLPEMHDFFKFAPTKLIIRGEQSNALLTNRVKPISFQPSEEDDPAGEEEKKQVPLGSQGADQNVEVDEAGSDAAKLSEVKRLLPYLVLCLDYKVAKKTMKCLQQLMVYGDLAMRISLVDQMIYLIKELMLEGPEEYVATQCLQTLTNMVKVWHQSETIKFQATTDQEIRPGFKLASYTVFDLVSAGGESLQAQALDDAAKNMYKELHLHLQMFDLLDMVSFLALCSKEVFARSLGCILIQESGKLKRLLVHKDKQRFILADVMYYNRDTIIEKLTDRLCLFYPLKNLGQQQSSQPAKSRKQLKQIFERLQFYQFIVDTFEYSRYGLTESLVRDIQVLYVGELAKSWKETLLKHTRVGGLILHYIQHLTGISLALYESKHGGGQQDHQISTTQKDSASFNLLLAVVLFNVTKSHDLRNRILKDSTAQLALEESKQRMRVAGDGSDCGEDEGHEHEMFSSGKLTTNTIMEEAATLIALTETGFNQLHRITFSSFYPARLWTSNVVLSFLFYLQEPLDQKSLRNLNEIFTIKRLDLSGKQQSFVENCLVFYALLLVNSGDQFTSYALDQIETEEARLSDPLPLGQSLPPTTGPADLAPSNSTDFSGYPISQNLREMTSILTNTLETVDLTDDALGKKKFTLRISMAHSICTCIRTLREKTQNRVCSTQYLSREQQIALLQETRSQFNSTQKAPDMQWLCPLIKEIWFCLLGFEAIIGGNLSVLDPLRSAEETKQAQRPALPAKLLDLKFLIQLEQDGFTGALKYYKYFHLLQPETSANPRSAASGDAARINEIKLLIQHVYAFFGQKKHQVPRQVLPDQPLHSDLSQISGFSAEVSQYSRYSGATAGTQGLARQQKNVYFKCLVNCVIDTIQLCKALESMKSVVQPLPGSTEAPEVKIKHAAQLAKSPFVPVYETLVNCIFKQSKANLESRLRKFCQSNLHSKIFLCSLFVGLNSTDKIFIEKARILSLAILPLMFPDPAYRKVVEDKIIAHAQSAQIKTLISHDNKHFYQFIKRVFLGEEKFNMEHHFEKYFSLSGFLRDVLNEIIKLQGAESDQPQISPKMMLKVLDIVTYFFSGNIDLRRAPHQAPTDQLPRGGAHLGSLPPPPSQEESFIFANLIDYKSFEFLSKLYKISEKLVDHDNDLLIMNMWYKVVENRTHNFEILTKFLIHNLSSFIMKLRATSSKDTSTLPGNSNSSFIQYQANTSATSLAKEEDAYGIEYEKQKRYSLSIFNYIKARTQQIDLRNSLNVASACSWSQKMIKLVVRAQLNLHSKYTLEKMKLKKILQLLHAEINQSGVRLELKGGLETLNRLLHADEKTPAQGQADYADVRRSVSMSQLLQSRTFMATFGGHNVQDRSTLKQLLFIVTRQMSEKFDELTPDNQITQLPDLVIKYFENTLIMIANESERLQIIKYSLKEEMTVTIIIMLLIADLATKQCEINRFYFMYDLLSKLTLNIAGIQRYLKLQTLSMEQFQSITSEDEVLAVFNYRAAVDHFGAFTQVYFKLLLNTVAIPKLHKFMLQLWWLIFEKVQTLVAKTDTDQLLRQPQPVQPLLRPFYSRKQIVTMLQGCFFTLHQYSLRAGRLREQQPDGAHQAQAELKATMGNFTTQIKCVLEYIQPAQLKMQSMRDFSDPFAQEISFATNAAFWVCFTCLETCAIAKSANPITESVSLDDTVRSGAARPDEGLTPTELRHLEAIQALGMVTMRRILEESDFLKLLIGIQKLSSHFYGYSLSLPKAKTGLLTLLFAALENPKSCEDAYKSLIVTIRIQDSQLLNCSLDDDEESLMAETELHRFLLLVPFFYQQFLGYNSASSSATRTDHNSQTESSQQSPLGLRRSTTIFTNKKSIIQLLKKSLLSLGIDKKKEILNILDEIQLEVDQGDPKVIKTQFGNLVAATCDICLAQGSDKLLNESLRTFRAIASQSSLAAGASDGSLVIEPEIIGQTVEQVRRSLESSTRPHEDATGLDRSSADFYSADTNQQLLGEDVVLVKREVRPLYFGLKNIILQEIESLDKEIDVHKFFIEQETAGFPASNHDIQSYVVNRSRSMYTGLPAGGQLGSAQKPCPSGSAPSEGYSDATSDIASTSQHQQTAGAGYPTVRAKKATKQQKEMLSKYHNSQNANCTTAQVPLQLSPQLVKNQSIKLGRAPSQTELQPPTITRASAYGLPPQTDDSSEQPYNYTTTTVLQPDGTRLQTSRTLQTAVRGGASIQSSQVVVLAQQQQAPTAQAEAQAFIQAQLRDPHPQVKAFEEQVRKQQTEEPRDYVNPSASSVFEDLEQIKKHGEYVELDFFADKGDMSRRSSSKVQLADDERKVQQEQLSQILFEQEDDDGKELAEFKLTGLEQDLEGQQMLDKVDVALGPSKAAARSFAESVMLEDQKHKTTLRESQKDQRPEFYPQQHGVQDGGASEQEYGGLLGTFAKPQASNQRQTRMPSIALTHHSKQMHGEVPLDRDFNFSQAALSSIDMRQQTDRQVEPRNNKVTASEEFGTGDFPQELKGNPNALMTEKDKFKTAGPAMLYQPAMDPNQSNYEPDPRLSQIKGESQNQHLQTQRFDAQRDFAQKPVHQQVPRTANGDKAHAAAAANVPPLKLGKAGTFLDTHNKEDLPTPKRSQQLDTILIEIMDDEDMFYDLENFLSEEKSYDVDSLAFYVKVMEFKKETSGLNATLAAGMIIDNYLAEEAQYYIGNEVKSDHLISELIGAYEQVITEQRPVPKDLFEEVCGQIKHQLMPYLLEFKSRQEMGGGVVKQAQQSDF